jgi:ureidoglycolate lyase
MMTTRWLTIEMLTAEVFAPFGTVIQLEGARHYPINAGSTERFHALAMTDTEQGGGRTGISLFRGKGFDLPFRLSVMERHPRSSQAFVPLAAGAEDRYLVIVAPPGELRLEELRAFLAQGFQGVQYARGTWHHPLIALNRSSDFLVVDRIAEDANCDEIPITAEIVAHLPDGAA